MPEETVSFKQRFWSKVEYLGPDECWEWTAGKLDNGYGQFWKTEGNQNVLAHRTAYELMVGEIPDGLTIDHLCRNRACVNPNHMEAVSRAAGHASVRTTEVHYVRAALWEGRLTAPSSMALSSATRVMRSSWLPRVRTMRGENVLRGVGPTAKNALKTLCKYGHEFGGKCLTHGKVYRYCKTCHRAKSAKRNQRKRDSVSYCKEVTYP